MVLQRLASMNEALHIEWTPYMHRQADAMISTLEMQRSTVKFIVDGLIMPCGLALIVRVEWMHMIALTLFRNEEHGMV